jgi:putative ABC transport system substrate-binding protein
MQRGLLAVVGLVAIVLAVMLWPSLRHGEAPASLKRIGVVSLTEVDKRTFEGFKEGMAKLGHVEQQTVQYLVSPPSGTSEVARQRIAELLAQGVDALLVSSTPVTQVAKELTGKQPIKVPVVFAPVNDPVVAGVVSSLREPGGNLTGIRLPVGDKIRLQWLRELAPQVRKVLVPFTPTDQSAQVTLQQLREVAALLNMQLLEVPVVEGAAFEAVVEKLPKADAILLPRDSRIEAKIDQWLGYARARRLPLSAPSLQQVEKGALYSYGFMHREIGKQAARLMDQILRGIPPGQLPVESADSFFGINLRAAAEIGLAVPDPVIRQASLVVQLQRP